MTDLLRHLIKDAQKYDSSHQILILKQTVQHIALLGLWRSHFFDHAAFYGGTALRILYGLNRFSEDLDFSLLKPQSPFNLSPYLKAIEREIQSFGLEMQVEAKTKTHQSPILSGFIKDNTVVQLMTIHVPQNITEKIHQKELVKIKFELDTDPPKGFDTEVRQLYTPLPYFVRAYTQQDLFAGKMQALLCPGWKSRVKGRDWFDLVWYVSKNIPLHTEHLKQRLINTGHLEPDQSFNPVDVQHLLMAKIAQLDIERAKEDVLPFIEDHKMVSCWSRKFFEELTKHITFV